MCQQEKQEKEKEIIKYNVWLKGEKNSLVKSEKILIYVFKLINLIYEVVQIKAYFSFFSFALPFTPSLISLVFLFLFENVYLGKLKTGRMTNEKNGEFRTQMETKNLAFIIMWKIVALEFLKYFRKILPIIFLNCAYTTKKFNIEKCIIYKLILHKII